MAVVDEVNGESNGNGEVEFQFDEGEEKKKETSRLIQIEPSNGGGGGGGGGGGNQNRKQEEEEETLYVVFHRLFTEIFYPEDDDHHKTSESTSLLQRIKSCFYENGYSLQKASKNSTDNLITWTRQGSPLRAILVISVGTNALVALTGLLVFSLFFLAATINAVIISLFMSLAAAGGFLALFFAFTTAIYIGALSVAVFVISIATITTIISVLITTGWVAFFWGLWWTAKKSIGIAECSLNMTGSALSAYSASRKVHHRAPDNDE